MRSIIDFLTALKVPILEVRWWERSNPILSKAEIQLVGLDNEFILAEHETPGGFLPVLLWYNQHYWVENQDPLQIPQLTEAQGYWRLTVGGEPPDEQLANLRQVRNPWNGTNRTVQPCFYIGPVTSFKPITRLLIHPILDLSINNYAVGGFIGGVDIPRQYFDPELRERTRKEG